MAPTTAAPGSVTASTPEQPVVRIRQYRPEDHAVVLKLFAAGILCYADFFPQFRQLWTDYIAESTASDLASIVAVYMQPGGNFWVATINEQVVGMVALENKSDGEGELRRMSIKAEARRVGVGRLLVAHLEQWAKASGYERVWLSTAAVQTQACKFYLSMGYEQTKSEVVNQDLGFELVHFAKSL